MKKFFGSYLSDENPVPIRINMSLKFAFLAASSSAAKASRDIHLNKKHLNEEGYEKKLSQYLLDSYFSHGIWPIKIDLKMNMILVSNRREA